MGALAQVVSAPQCSGVARGGGAQAVGTPFDPCEGHVGGEVEHRRGIYFRAAAQLYPTVVACALGKHTCHMMLAASCINGNGAVPPHRSAPLAVRAHGVA